MSLLKPRKKTRVCVIGLDGVPYDLIAAPGATGRHAGHGPADRLRAPPQDEGQPARDLGRDLDELHDRPQLRDARHLRLHRFQARLLRPSASRISRTSRRRPSGTSSAAKAGAAIVINQPSTYPARPVERRPRLRLRGDRAGQGRLSRRPSWPPSRRWATRSTSTPCKSREDHDFLWQELAKTSGRAARRSTIFWDEDWDYFEFVITGTDRLHHYLWDAYEDDSPSLITRASSTITGRSTRSSAGSPRPSAGSPERTTGSSSSPTTASRGIEQEVYLNAWLEKRRLSELRPGRPEGARGHLGREPWPSPSTRTASISTSRASFPTGSVEPAEAKPSGEEITAGLASLEHGGRRSSGESSAPRRSIPARFASARPGPPRPVASRASTSRARSRKRRSSAGRTSRACTPGTTPFSGRPTITATDLAIADLAADHPGSVLMRRQDQEASTSPGLRVVPCSSSPRSPLGGAAQAVHRPGRRLRLPLLVPRPLPDVSSGALLLLSWPFRFLLRLFRGQKAYKNSRDRQDRHPRAGRHGARRSPKSSWPRASCRTWPGSRRRGRTPGCGRRRRPSRPWPGHPS